MAELVFIDFVNLIAILITFGIFSPLNFKKLITIKRSSLNRILISGIVSYLFWVF